jgi:hypothetical protein
VSVQIGLGVPMGILVASWGSGLDALPKLVAFAHDSTVWAR